MIKNKEVIKKVIRKYTKEICHDVVIIGAGTGGTSIASRFNLIKNNLNIAILEPSVVHYYQPGFTLVGGMKNYSKKRRKSKKNRICKINKFVC
jgi:sulfide:quinone oxidoreductase